MDIFCDNLIRIPLQKMDLWGTIELRKEENGYESLP